MALLSQEGSGIAKRRGGGSIISDSSKITGSPLGAHLSEYLVGQILNCFWILTHHLTCGFAAATPLGQEGRSLGIARNVIAK
jgi:hypothetical protein